MKPDMQTVLDDILRWEPAKIEELQAYRMRKMIELCYDRHPHYSKLMRERGLKPSDFQELSDLEKFPITTKADFVANPESFRLNTDGMDVEDMAISRVIYTTGSTTGVPAPVYVSASDHFDYMLRSKRRRDFIDIREGDLIVSLFPLTPYPMGAYGRALAEAAACGASLLELNPGKASEGVSPHRSTTEVIDLLSRSNPSILWGIPSYILRVLHKMSEMGMSLPTLRMVMVTGEGLSKSMNADIKTAMRALGVAEPEVVNRYGSTEQGSAMVNCTPGSGFHELAPDTVYMEALDSESGASMPDGQEGELAFTHLNRSGTVLIRFAVGDRAVLSHEQCKHCGRFGARIVQGPSRSGDIVKVKGTLVNLSSVVAHVLEIPGVKEAQVVVAREDQRDSLNLRICLTDADVNGDLVSNEVISSVKRTAVLTPSVEIVTHDDLVGAAAAGKYRRVVDRREKEDVK